MKRKHPEIRTYAQAAAYLGDKPDRPLPGRYTRLRRDTIDGGISVVYHWTAVVHYLPDRRRIRLDTGGWSTVTTKARIWAYTRARIYSDRGVFYLDTYRRRPHMFRQAAVIDAASGAPISIDGARVPHWRKQAAARRAELAKWARAAARAERAYAAACRRHGPARTADV